MNKKLIYILMVCYCCTAISKNANFIKTEHVIIQNGQELPYQAAAGKLPVKNTEGKEIGKVFFISYTLNTQEKHRPVTFIFNGGPGSSSVWLHLGAFGPKRVKLIEEGQRITAPYELLDNEETLLGVTDLVFVDPIGTGFSSFSEGVQKDLFSVEGDCLYLSEFIRDYLTENQRWNSPKYIIGESYGSTRTAGLSSYLLEHGIFLNGIILVSSALDFKNFVFSEDNLLPYIFFLPSYTAAAWHHNQLSKTFTSLEEAVAYSRKFAFDVYLPALMKGANLTEREKESLAKQLNEITGISKEKYLIHDCRISDALFFKYLLEEQKKTIGRMDARDTGCLTVAPDALISDPSFKHDGIFTSLMNDYLVKELQYKESNPYQIFSSEAHMLWDFSPVSFKFLNIKPFLRQAMMVNPELKVFVINGYYDLATPFFNNEYIFQQLDLPEEMRENISMKNYVGGHMMYLDLSTRKELRKDLEKFYN